VLSLVNARTLTRNSAVESIALYEEGLARTLAVSFENIHRFDRVFRLSAIIDGLDGKHGIDGHGSEQIIIAETR